MADRLTEIEERQPPCVTCGKPHVLRLSIPKGFYGSWADPDDGHPYRPESWESLGRKYLALHPDPGEEA